MFSSRFRRRTDRFASTSDPCGRRKIIHRGAHGRGEDGGDNRSQRVVRNSRAPPPGKTADQPGPYRGRVLSQRSSRHGRGGVTAVIGYRGTCFVTMFTEAGENRLRPRGHVRNIVTMVYARPPTMLRIIPSYCCARLRAREN